MTRAFLLGCCIAILTCGTGLAGPKKPPAGAPAPRMELSPPAVAPANAPPGTAHPNPLNVYGAQYPRIEADNRVTFHFNAPNAQKVQVGLVTPGQGNLNPIPVDMVKGDDGVWSYTSAPQSPGYHNYWMFVDGAPVLDTATNAFIGYSHMCNGYEIPEAGVDWYDLKDVPSPSARGVTFSSTRRRGMMPTRKLATRYCICSTAVAKMSASGPKWATQISSSTTCWLWEKSSPSSW